MRQHDVKLTRDQELSIKRMFYLGDEGSISCDVTPPGMEKTPIICLITHIEISLDYPLAQEIRAYQTVRARKLGQAGREPTSFTVRVCGRKRRRRAR